MGDFTTSLVREKIVFVDDSPKPDGTGGDGSTVVRSNRILLKLPGRTKTERIVIRSQNMHTTLRMTSRIMTSYYKSNIFTDRETPFDWAEAWDSCLSTYEKHNNPDIWAAVYIDGQPMFKTNSSPFIDVVEKCALLSIDDYDATMNVTENALKQIGKQIRISHASNIAAALTNTGGTMRCGIIHRTDGRNTTFSFNATGGDDHNRVTQSLSIAGALLEAINLRFMVRNVQADLRRGEIEKNSPEAVRMRSAASRVIALSKGITNFESVYEVKYRPEKPDLIVSNI